MTIIEVTSFAQIWQCENGAIEMPTVNTSTSRKHVLLDEVQRMLDICEVVV